MTPEASSAETTGTTSTDERRDFLRGLAAFVVGSLVALIPLLAGVVMFAHPLRRRSKKGGVDVVVANLNQLPDDGIPRRFPVITERMDAWTLHPKATIGSVYLTRQPGESQPVAFSATCPHLGCMVDFKQSNQRFQCPCHNSFFQQDGSRINPEHCPSPRDLDRLEVSVDDETQQITVRFQKFRSGASEPIPES